jgi:phenylalanyl-tRNA synthetase alpha subunit
MKKFSAALLLISLLLISVPQSSQALQPKRNRYEDTVNESIWDWATTLGKSPQEKKTIKAKRRIQRVKARAEKKAKAEKARLEKENIAREKEAQRIRAARIKARRKEIQQEENQQVEEIIQQGEQESQQGD